MAGLADMATRIRPAVAAPEATVESSAPPTGQLSSVYSRVASNSFWLLVTRLAIQAQLALFTLLVARRLGAALFGQYAFIASVLSVANVLTTFGTDTLLIRDVARTRSADRSLLPAALWIQLLLSALVIVAVAFGADALPDKTQDMLVSLKLYALSLLPWAFYGVFTAVLRGFERMDLFLWANLATSVLQLVGTWLAFQISIGLQPLIVALLASQVIAAIVAGGLSRRYVPGFGLMWRPSAEAVRAALRRAWPLAALGILAVIYQRLGVLTLSLGASDAQTGLFSAAARIIEPLKMVHFAVLGALLPALSRLTGPPESGHGGHASAQVARRLFRMSVVILLGLAAVLAALLVLVAGRLVSALFGAEYAPAALPLQVMAWSLIPYTVSAGLSLRLITLGEDRKVLKATAVGLVFTVILNGWLVPSFGVIGAAWALLGSEVMQAAAFLAVRRMS